MNRNQWWAAAAVLFASTYLMFAAMTDKSEYGWRSEVVATTFPFLWILATIAVVCFVCGFLEKQEGKKK